MGAEWWQASDARWYPPPRPEVPPAQGALRGTLGAATPSAAVQAPPPAPRFVSPDPIPAVSPPAALRPPGAPSGPGVVGAPAIGAVVAGPVDAPDRYRLVELCSRGGEGELWRGEIRIDRVGIPVAVKVIHPSNAVNLAEWRTRWQRQAELLRSLDHRGLVKVRDVFDGPVPHYEGHADPTSRSLFLVMNWVEGLTLEQWVQAYPRRSFTDSLRVIDRLAAAVDHLHAGGVGGWPIVHRDIKPANVIIDGADACLVDFGFARILSDQPMTLVGTPNYLAPEVVSYGMYSEASDRFALGGTAFFAFTGERPATNDPQQMVRALCSVRGIEGRVDVADVVLQMLREDPHQRPRSAAEWVRSLEAIAGGGRSTMGSAAPRLDAGAPSYAGPAGSPRFGAPRATSDPSMHAPPAPTPASTTRSIGSATIAIALIAFLILIATGVAIGLALT